VDSLNEAELKLAIFQGKAKNIDDTVQIALEYEAFQNGRRKWGLIKPVRMQTEVETDYEISSSRNQIFLALPWNIANFNSASFKESTKQLCANCSQ
jgi:hypothetical protein